MFRHKIFLFIFTGLMLLAGTSCHRTDKSAPTIDTVPALVMQVQQCSRLYTSEYNIHKIITHSDELRVTGNLFSHDVSVKVPMGGRKIAIPVDATLKAYIDFSGFSEKNVIRSGKKILIILPDPRVMVTGTKVDQRGVREYVQLVRPHFSSKEMADYERQGRETIIKSIPELGIVGQARDNAACILIPMIQRLGYSENDITITFRKGFVPGNVVDMIDNTIIRNEKK
jgi:hypothetical protein